MTIIGNIFGEENSGIRADVAVRAAMVALPLPLPHHLLPYRQAIGRARPKETGI